MNDLEDYPLAPLVNALNTVAGRVALVFAAIIVGAALGGLTATGEMAGAWEALGSFFDWAAASFLFGAGFIAFPVAFLFALLFVRGEWPLWTVAVVVLLVWWNGHKTLSYLLHESAGAKARRQIDSIMEDAAKRSQEGRNSP